MMQKMLQKTRAANSRAAMVKIAQRAFGGQLPVNFETSQPAAADAPIGDYHVDTRRANSKYYNPQSFDPASMDYQRDVRLAVRDELPTEINAEDITESMYAQIFSSELVWPPLFFSTWAAFEPDVSFAT